MSSEATTTSGGLVVVTQVYPSNQPQPQEDQQEGPRTQRFVQVYPQAVGTVQIMIGVIVLLSGIIKVFYSFVFEVASGFFVWGASFYITSGALTVAAGKSLSRPLINTALGFNVVSAVAAFAGIVLYSIDALINFFRSREMGLGTGFSGVLVVFHVLEFVVSITVSVFASRATCNCCDNQQHPYVHFTSAQAPADAAPATMSVPP